MVFVGNQVPKREKEREIEREREREREREGGACMRARAYSIKLFTLQFMARWT